MTATPIRLDSRGLGGELYQELICGPSIEDLTAQGFLVPIRIFAPARPSLKGVHLQAGDYNSKELATACDKPKLIGDIVDHWHRLGEERQTILFAVSVHHSQDIVSQFTLSGIRCEHLDSKTPDADRAAILRRLASGETRIVSNVGIMSEGFDCPPVSCIVLARPTKSVSLYLQMVGRALRPHPGKTDCLILDHSSGVYEHGLPDEEREWSLDGAAGVRTKPRDTEEAVRMCKQCWMAFRSSQQACPNCGWKYTGRLCEIEHEAGELEEIQRQRKATAIEEWLKRQGVPERRAKFLEFVRLGAERGYRPGFAIARYRGIFKEDPPREWISEAMAAAAREEDGMGEAVNG